MEKSKPGASSKAKRASSKAKAKASSKAKAKASSKARARITKARRAPGRKVKKSGKSKKTKKVGDKPISAPNEDSSKYIGLLNEALKHIHQGEIEDVFLSSDNVLWSSGFLEQGIKRGFRLLKSGKYQLDQDCNVVCLSNALLVFTMIYSDYHELSDLQKLYLFFLDYLNKYGNERTDKTLPLDYALKTIEKELSQAKEYHKKKVAGKAKAKSIKTATTSIAKIELRKQEVIDRYKVKDDDDWPWSGPLPYMRNRQRQVYWINEDTGEFSYTDPAERFPHSRPFDNLNKVDICGQMDCIYLHEDKFIQNPELGEPIDKFCNHAILIFKGLIWMLMKEFSESQIHRYKSQSGGGDLYCEHEDCLESVETYTKEELEKHMEEVHDEPESSSEPEIKYQNALKLDLSMRELVDNTNLVLIPFNEIFFDEDTYGPDEEKFYEKAWAYHKMKQVLVGNTGEDLYLTANLGARWGKGRWAIHEFLDGDINPILTRIEIINKSLPNGTSVPQLKEVIDNSITEHWYVAPIKKIYDNVMERMAV